MKMQWTHSPVPDLFLVFSLFMAPSLMGQPE